MASKSTKVTPRLDIVPPSSSTVPVSCTVAASAASKSTSCKAHQKGEWAEELVARFFVAKQYIILKRRWRTPYAELDLVVENSRHEIWIIEIKTLSSFEFINV